MPEKQYRREKPHSFAQVLRAYTQGATVAGADRTVVVPYMTGAVGRTQCGSNLSEQMGVAEQDSHQSALARTPGT